MNLKQLLKDFEEKYGLKEIILIGINDGVRRIQLNDEYARKEIENMFG